jgi:nitroreductase
MDTKIADELLTTTRAVRKRLDLDRPVPRGVIHECIDVASQAPTGSNAQGWRWVVVTDPERKTAIAEVYREVAYPYLDLGAQGIESQPPERQTQQRRVLDSARHLADVIDRVPVHVIPCILGAFGEEVVPSAMVAGFYGSIFPAVWSFQLALRARGLGSCLTTFHLAHADRVGELLGIPDTVTQSCLLPVAYTKGTDFKPAERRPASEITYWESWKDTG